MTGQERWTLTLGATGVLTRGLASIDGSILALVSTAEGGRIFILQDGKLVNSIPARVDDIDLSVDGKVLVVTVGNQLHRYDPLAGLVWTFTGDDILRTPHISADTRRIACGSELGTLYVHTADGKSLLARDRGAWPIPAWLPDGDLLVLGWNGRIARLSGEDFSVRWTKQLETGNF